MTTRIRLSKATLLSLILMALIFVAPWRAPDAAAKEAQIDQAASERGIEAWRDKRFGMFIHWGPVSLKGVEIGWTRGDSVPIEEYDQLYKRFNPTKFDADQWVRIAKDAGMKYVVITSKHHDGFCLWPSKYTDYDIANTPFQRDILKELKEACDKQGVQFCTYYSLPDWHDPDYPLGSPGGETKHPNPDMPRFYERIRNQTKELIENYGPLGLMWFDGDWEKPWNRDYGDRLYAELKHLQPTLVINDRVSKRRYVSPAEKKTTAGDYLTQEQRIGIFNRDFPWETCMTIGDQWAWKPNDNVKSLEDCIHSLLRSVGGDGNFLLNVGPTPEGEIEPRQAARLREMGDWLKKYGDGVYGTRGGPFKSGMWGASTCKDNRVFLYLWAGWPARGRSNCRRLTSGSSSPRASDGSHASVRQDDTGVYIDIPEAERSKVANVIELTFDGKAFDIEPVNVDYHSGSLARDKKTTASNVYGNQAVHGAGRATDDDQFTRWATDPDQKEAWLEVDLGGPKTIGRVFIDEPIEYQRIQEYELQAFDGKDWKSFHHGTTIGPEQSLQVKPVTASKVRLHILRASDGPTIREFQLYGPGS